MQKGGQKKKKTEIQLLYCFILDIAHVKYGTRLQVYHHPSEI